MATFVIDLLSAGVGETAVRCLSGPGRVGAHLAGAEPPFVPALLGLAATLHGAVLVPFLPA